MGSYFHPKRVYIIENIIKDIPDREYFAGFAEILKCGLIGNKKILNYLKQDKHLFKRTSTKKFIKNYFGDFKNQNSFFLKMMLEKKI